MTERINYLCSEIQADGDAMAQAIADNEHWREIISEGYKDLRVGNLRLALQADAYRLWADQAFPLPKEAVR